MTGLQSVSDPLRETTAAFYELERSESLFEARIDGVPIWERIRFRVHRRLLRQLGVIEQAHSSVSQSSLRVGRRLGRNLFSKNPFVPSDVDVLVYGHERRKRLDDGHWWDIYCDPLTTALDWDYLHIEQPHLGDHRTPARTDRLRYVDLIQYGAGALNLVRPDRTTVSPSALAPFERAQRAIQARFDATVDVAGLAREAALTRATRLPLWRALLRRLDPDICLVVVGYRRRTFVEACQREGIPVAELQHGIIYPDHLGYAYPHGDCETAPDYLLTFGPYWTDAAPYPIPDENVVGVGYPYLEAELTDRDPMASETVVFLSQGTVGRRLSELAVEVARALPDRDIVFKLHPGEVDRWRSVHPRLADSPVRVVSDSDTQLYDLFTEAGTQVGVNSTALYEGVAFGLETYLLAHPGVTAMEQLVGAGGATVVTDADELVEQLLAGTRGGATPPESVFTSDAVANVDRFVRSVTDDRP